MDLHRLASSLRVVSDELQENKTITRLTQLADAAQNAAASPADTALIATFTQHADALTNILKESATQYVGPSTRRVLTEIGFHSLLAPDLLKQTSSQNPSKFELIAK